MIETPLVLALVAVPAAYFYAFIKAWRQERRASFMRARLAGRRQRFASPLWAIAATVGIVALIGAAHR